MVGPSPLFPDVPIAPGVPPVFRDAANSGDASGSADALTSDAPSVASTSPWGLYAFPGGAVALACDSVVALEPRREARIADYQIEKGGFQTYNKVMTSGIIRLTVAKGGTDDDRTAFMAALNKLLESTDLFNVVAPDFSGVNYNLVNYDMRRTAQSGATLLIVDLECMEVRESASVQFTDSKQPSGADVVNAGPQQSLAAGPSELPIASTGATDPGIADIPAIDSTASIADKAATVASVINAGGSIGDLVAKGVGFLSVPLLATAAQTLTTTLNEQPVRLDVLQKAFGLAIDVYVDGSLIIGGVAAENDNPIVRNSYLGFLGDLYFHDTQGGDADPTFAELGSRFALLYAGA